MTHVGSGSLRLRRRVLVGLLPMAACFDEPVDIQMADTDPTMGVVTGTGGPTSTTVPLMTFTSEGVTTEPAEHEGTGGTEETGTTTSGFHEDPSSGEGSTSAPGDEVSSGGEETTEATTTGGGDDPVIQGETYLGRQGDTVEVSGDEGLLANDVGVGLRVTEVEGGPGSLTWEDDGSVSYEPPPAWWGEAEFEYRVVDDAGASDTAVVRFLIAPRAIPSLQVASGVGGYSLDGPVIEGEAGHAIRFAGDFDGDELDDVAIAAYRHDRGSELDAGFGWVVRGAVEPESVVLDEEDGILQIEGLSEQGIFGFSVARAGDLDGDGREDVAFGEPGAPMAYVVGGRTNFETLRTSDIGTAGFGFSIQANGTRVAETVSHAGDVNGDGVADLLVSARFMGDRGQNSGAVFVVFGDHEGANRNLNNVADGQGGFVVYGEDEGDEAGSSAAGIGDLNGDGLDDIVIGARYAGPDADGDGRGTGRAYVVYGKRTTEAVELTDVAAGQGGWAVVGQREDDRLGFRVSGAGDVNGDGHPDVAIGARRSDNGASANSGSVFVVLNFDGPGPLLATDLIDGVGGYVIQGERAGDEAGSSVAGGVTQSGDFNGDGFDELVIGAWGANAAGASDNGRVYVVYGRPDPTTVELQRVATGQGGFAIDGEATDDRLGGAVDIGGDVNGDGFSDVVAGSAFTSTAGLSGSGRGYVVLGGDFADRVHPSTPGDDELEAGDGADRFVLGQGNDRVTGLGRSDVAYGGPGDDVFEVEEGGVARIDGGPGQDTVRFVTPGPLVVDLRTLSRLRLDRVETLDLGNGEDRELHLRIPDVARSYRRTLRVLGEGGRVVIYLDGNPLRDNAVTGGFRHLSSDVVNIEVQEDLAVSMLP